MVAYVHPGPSVGQDDKQLRAFRRGLQETGFVHGQNVIVEPERLPDLLAALVRRNVAVIAALGGTRITTIAKAATSRIPVISSSRRPRSEWSRRKSQPSRRQSNGGQLTHRRCLAEAVRFVDEATSNEPCLCNSVHWRRCRSAGTSAPGSATRRRGNRAKTYARDRKGSAGARRSFFRVRAAEGGRSNRARLADRLCDA